MFRPVIPFLVPILGKVPDFEIFRYQIQTFWFPVRFPVDLILVTLNIAEIEFVWWVVVMVVLVGCRR